MGKSGKRELLTVEENNNLMKSEELQIDKYNTMFLGDFILDQMHDPYTMVFAITFNRWSNHSTHSWWNLMFHDPTKEV